MTDIETQLKPEQRLAIHTYCIEKAKRKGAFQGISNDDLMMLEEKTKGDILISFQAHELSFQVFFHVV